MDWKKVALNVLRSLNKYLNLSDLSDDAQVEIVNIFEKLEEDERMPIAVTQTAEMLGIDVSDVVAVLVARLLNIMETYLNDEVFIDVEEDLVEDEIVDVESQF